VFVFGKPFQPSLVSVGLAGTYSSKASFMYSMIGWATVLTHKHHIVRQGLARDKHSSLLRKSVILLKKSFMRLTPGVGTCQCNETFLIIGALQ